MYRVFVIVGLCVLALAIIIGVTTCIVAQPPVGSAQSGQHQPT